MQQIQYFKSAWGDIKNSPSWFGKICLLALVNFIPIFGQIVMLGYLYGWAREIAWGAHEPMPTRIFGNEDGKLYRRGWFILVLMFVAALVPSIVMGIGSSMQGAGLWGVASDSHAVANSLLSGLGLLLYLIGFIGALLLSVLAWIGSMRISIYDRLSAGFQVGKIWKMFRHDTNGAMRIFGMYLLVGLIIGIILSIIFFIITFLVVLAGVAGMAASGYNVAAIEHMSSNQVTAFTMHLIASVGVIGLLAFLVVAFLSYMASVFVMLLIARAMGYWTMQFDVPHWRGQDDPMPFETTPSVMAAQPVVPVPPAATQAQNDWYSQPIQQTQPMAQTQPMPDATAPMQAAEAAAAPITEPITETTADSDVPADSTEALDGFESADSAQETAPIEPGQLSGFTYTGMPTATAAAPAVTPSGADPSQPVTPDVLVVVPENPQNADNDADAAKE